MTFYALKNKIRFAQIIKFAIRIIDKLYLNLSKLNHWMYVTAYEEKTQVTLTL